MVTQPYQVNPRRSASMSGRIVITANDSNATKVTIDTSPIVNERCLGLKIPDSGSASKGPSSRFMIEPRS